MTLAEIAVLCERDDKPGEGVASNAELQAYLRDWWAMTPEERLWAEELP